jgi:hypothetical protein
LKTTGEKNKKNLSEKPGYLNNIKTKMVEPTSKQVIKKIKIILKIL